MSLEENSYEEMAGLVLAQVADLLLSGKRDWATLERVQAALTPPTPWLSTDNVDTTLSPAMEDLIKTIYTPNVKDMLKDNARFQRLAEDQRVTYISHTAPGDPASGAVWINPA